MIDPTEHIDATGLTCPMPLMLLKQKVNELSIGSGVLISVTDPHAELDFVTWCERFGHDFESVHGNEIAESTWTFKITKNQ